MTEEEENLAIVFELRRVHGPATPAYICMQIGRLAVQGDEAGIARWKTIAAKFQEYHQRVVQ